jgi:hypothetical protein
VTSTRRPSDRPDPDELADLAGRAADAIRALNRATLTRPALPAPVLASITGSLATLTGRLPQLLAQLGGCLAASLDEHPTGYRVEHDSATDPLPALLTAEDHLADAIPQARALAADLDIAWTALTHLRHVPATDPDDDHDEAAGGGELDGPIGGSRHGRGGPR